MNAQSPKDIYKRTRLSYAHENRELRQQNGLYEKAYTPLKAGPEHSDRSSYMIKRQRPQFVMRPPHTMACGPDRDAFNAQLDKDDERARRAFIKEAHTEIEHLKRAKHQLRAEAKTVTKVAQLERQGRSDEARKSTYKAMRRLSEMDSHSEERFQAFFRRHAQR